MQPQQVPPLLDHAHMSSRLVNFSRIELDELPSTREQIILAIHRLALEIKLEDQSAEASGRSLQDNLSVHTVCGLHLQCPQSETFEQYQIESESINQASIAERTTEETKMGDDKFIDFEELKQIEAPTFCGPALR